MNLFAKHNRLFTISLLSSLMLGPILSSCGSTDGDTIAGIGGTGITQGEITAFGSIFVNGIEFETNQSQFEVDGDTTLNEDDLRIGMVVKITGSVSSDGLTGDADSVEYDDEIQGPVASITAALDDQRILTVFDKTITIDESTTSFDSTDFASIKINDIVEVSGFQTSATELDATYVKKTGEFAVGEDVELKGTITNLNSDSFEFGTIKINYENDDIEDGITLVDGLFVEVEGKLRSATEIDADEIEAEDENDFEDGEEISLQGVISMFISDSNFMINGQAVNGSGAELSPANIVLANGLNVEVDGEISSGVLIADEVELREGEVEIKAFVFDKDLSTNQIEFTFLAGIGSIFVTTDNQTEFEDETGSSDPFTLNEIVTNDFIKIEGIDTGSQIIASQVKRLDSSGEDIEVQGVVESFIEAGRVTSITLFGVNFSVDNVTNPGFNIGAIVEIKDEGPIFGTIDEIVLED